MKTGVGKTVKKILAVFALLLLFAIAGTGIYTVSESEQAVVLTFGKTTGISGPGLHFKIPFIQKVYKADTTIKGFDVGYTTSNGSSGDPQYTSTPDSMMITADYNFITVDFYVEYRVTDAEKALFSSENPELILKNIAQNSIRTTIGSYTVDSVLTTGKNEIQSNIYTMISKKLDSYDIGIQLVSISMQDAEPPTAEISEAFKAVETAKQGKETAINNANKYRNEQIPAANADADKIVQDAEAEKQRRINEATGQVARFQSEYEEYKKFPAMTKRRMFYETMEDVLPGMKVVILSKDGDTQTLLPLDDFYQTGKTAEKTTEETTSEVKTNETEVTD